MGFIPGIRSENIYGKTYGQTTTISANQTHHVGSDLTGDLRYTSIMQENYVNFDPKSSHISDFNPLRRFGLGVRHQYPASPSPFISLPGTESYLHPPLTILVGARCPLPSLHPPRIHWSNNFLHQSPSEIY